MRERRTIRTQIVKTIAHCSHGSASIEFVLWMPVFIFILLMTVDATVILLTRTDMTNVARDVVRRISTGEFNAAQAEEQAKAQLLFRNNAYSVSVDPDMYDPEMIQVQISTSLADAGAFGFFGAFTSENVSTSVTMRKEHAPSLPAP